MNVNLSDQQKKKPLWVKIMAGVLSMLLVLVVVIILYALGVINAF